MIVSSVRRDFGFSLCSNCSNNFLLIQAQGSINTGEGFSSTTIRPKTYTSALTLIVSNPKSDNIRHELYSPTTHSAAHHEYVDRAEDIIVESPHPSLVVKPSNLPPASEEQHAGNEYVTISVSESSSYATYKSARSESHEIIDTKSTRKQSSTLNVNELKARSGENVGTVADTKRKTSLQITPKNKPKTDGYERLESYASETSVNISSSNLDSWRRDFASEDDLYESTATINSTLRSDSMENTLTSLEKEMSKTYQGKLDLLMHDMEGYSNTTTFDSIEEIEYSTVNKTKKISGTYDNDYFTKETSAISTASRFPIASLKFGTNENETDMSTAHAESNRETTRSETVIEVQDTGNIIRKAAEKSEKPEITEKNKTMSLPKPKRKSKESQAKLAVNTDTNKKSSIEENVAIQHQISTNVAESISSNQSDNTYQLKGTGRESEMDFSAELNKEMEGMMLGLNMSPSKWFELDQSADSDQPSDDWTVNQHDVTRQLIAHLQCTYMSEKLSHVFFS